MTTTNIDLFSVNNQTFNFQTPSALTARASEAFKDKSFQGQVPTPDPRTRKQIASDIFLEKQYETPGSGNGSEVPRYVFRIISKSLRHIIYDVNISESDNITNFEEKKGLGPFKNSIEPSKIYEGAVQEQTTLICRIRLKDNWKLKFKFNFALSNPPK